MPLEKFLVNERDRWLIKAYTKAIFTNGRRKTLRQIQVRETLKISTAENLAEELVALGRAEKTAILSYLEQLLIHILLYQYWKPVRYL